MEIGMLDPKLLLDVYLATFYQNNIKILLIEKSTTTRVINTILGEVNVEHSLVGGVLPLITSVIQMASGLVVQ